MPSIAITMPYIGAVLSVNHYKHAGGRYTRPETKAWMDALALQARSELNRFGLRPEPPITISLRGYFKDGRSAPDLANLHKVIGDSLGRPTRSLALPALWWDDKHFRFIDLGCEIDAENPRLEITVSWGAD